MKNNLVQIIPSVIQPHLPPILFVHGAWHGAWCWQENFMPYFTKKGFRTYAFDLTHHGQFKDQPNINKIRIRDYVKNLEEAIDKLGEPCILIGHSMGGFIIQEFLVKNDCLAAVLMAAVPRDGVLRLYFKMWRTMPIAMLKMSLFFNLFQIVNTPKKAQYCFFSSGISRDKLEKYTQQLGSESMSVMVFDLLFANIKNRNNPEIPVLVQCAGKDEVVSIKENEHTAEFQNADYQFFDELAHDMMLEENWKLSAESILDWLLLKFPNHKERLVAQKINK